MLRPRQILSIDERELIINGHFPVTGTRKNILRIQENMWVGAKDSRENRVLRR